MTGVRVFGSNKSTGVIISIFLERSEREGDARVCRDFYQKKGRGKGLPRKDLRASERKDMALVEYTFGRVEGIDLNQRNVNAYLSHDGIWIDIHLSKPGFEPAEQGPFDAILDSVRILGAAPSPEGRPGAPSGAPVDPTVQSLQAPGRDWFLVLNTLGAKLSSTLEYDFDQKDGQVSSQRVIGSKWEGGSESSGLLLIVSMGRAANGGDAVACRDYFWRSARYMPAGRKTDVRLSERGDMALVEFMTPRLEGQKVDVKTVLAFLSRDGLWLVLQLSRVDFRPEHQALFDIVLDSVRINPERPTHP